MGGSPDSPFSVASARRLGSRRLRGLRVKPGGEEDGGKCRLLTKPFREVNRQGRIPLREGRLSRSYSSEGRTTSSLGRRGCGKRSTNPLSLQVAATFIL